MKKSRLEKWIYSLLIREISRLSSEKYHVYHAIKLGNYNVGEKDRMMTLPLYMAIFL